MRVPLILIHSLITVTAVNTISITIIIATTSTSFFVSLLRYACSLEMRKFVINKVLVKFVVQVFSKSFWIQRNERAFDFLEFWLIIS